jgi:hypothetical protein
MINKNNINNRDVKRSFWTSDGWYVYMREGDEQHISYVNFRKVKFQKEGNGNIAGPFRSKRQMDEWYTGFISMHAYARKNESYIRDDIIFPESNMFVSHCNPPLN